tara:strand:- start:1650 stop:2165 length:516 start_codon:yes stop_codon:yes gene_type:complete
MVKKKMNKITSGKDTVYTKHNFLNNSECKKYIARALRPGKEVLKRWYKDCNSCWNDLEITITDEPIVSKVHKYIKKELDINLKIRRAYIQTWMPTTFSGLHIHNDPTETATWNSCLYLNDDFEGGYYFTRNGLVIKPEPGLLTLFKGTEVSHGVGEVKKNYRFSLVFWWEI